MLIALATVYGLEIHHINVKIIFLNENFEEKYGMEQHEDYVVPDKEIKVHKFISHFMS